MAPLISVIVPVYKAEDTLRNCVDSILKQTNRDFELLLIDDGSRIVAGIFVTLMPQRMPVSGYGIKKMVE